ncbi:Sarcosine oxidase subunit alpha [Bosea sp. 62]|uniref:(2Fe-2S)-binding protein n=1 Tax=unclassified Bosea (in: a-proteobacteria) TaxID=2653178 RepID=UPI00125B1389|nr:MULTISPECIES: (2Fe-2S)-binding protein [unclassified Bosea (in: a-proteobacteria)]CAD5248946.1 Sarcosine oxidase subunit alpha [Bosea sp. 46]CAD5250033.1 Sarcosine oxidase subunit alpha [Bosea sp. 21B]CAD5265821.1 Sarcosine oxidase subunit alpha [Bosea sp. 7B]VVT44631.1 Sarcosine oxidase subunit alpha [Bosea sp. EC-HK365B]VXB06091.1 Sarcosine oxidase subunit alpha [Bosea sp. 29B]
MASNLRIGSTWARTVSFRFDGETLTAPEGETLAAALYAQGRRTLRISRDDGGPRGAFCFMGVCQECVVSIDGKVTEACRTPVHEGLVVESVR